MFGLKKKISAPQKPGMLSRLRQSLQKTRNGIFSGLADLFRRHAGIDAELLEEIETRLLQADLGIESTTRIIDGLKAARGRDELHNMDDLLPALREEMLKILRPVQQPLQVSPALPRPLVILTVGVNGVGKTTTIGKLANHLQNSGYNTLLAAGDTFRAAAIEQLQAWGARIGCPVIAQQSGADSAAVIYDALESARAGGRDVVIADTAGRLHNKSNLMEELKKIRRIIGKVDSALPVEVLLVIDAGTGQNALVQAREFHQAVGLSGIVLTKLDGTARGGVVFALAQALSIPIRFIGVGEQAEDLRPFIAEEFVDALLDLDS